MKLFDLKEPCWARITGQPTISGWPTVPIGSVPLVKGDIIYFHHIDGMYSFCEDQQGRIVHPAAWTEVELVEDEIHFDGVSSND